MSRTALVDAMYEAFAGSLPNDLRDEARGLSVTLGLAPNRDVLWSAVFRHAVTLGAPLLVADATPQLGGAVVHDAVSAHLLAMIGAVADDRILAGVLAPSRSLEAVLDHVRGARNDAIARVAAPEARAYDDADQEAREAVVEERRILLSGCAIDRQRYLAVALAKQRRGVPASMALARAAGWEPRRRQALGELLDGVWMGQQLHDDVVDWEPGAARGGSWVVALAGGSANLPRDPDGVSMRGAVHASGVLGRLLQAAARRYAGARRRARALGARRLEVWAREREATLRELSRREAESPGFAGRSRALSAWARSGSA
ncbi:MAG: hypothetical protein ABJE95_31905 [Byssovorax sp.]